MADNLWAMSAVELAAGIRRGDFTSTEVVDDVLGRIQKHNPVLNAITFDCSAEALATAESADKARAAGQALGPLHGVPVTVKENVDQRGTPNTNGLPAQADFMADDDSPVVSNLRKAGAIIIGRTNTPELSMRGTTDNPLRGRTVNPWSEPHSPGGSSGGAGVSAAMGFGPVHHGNDIGGSLRFPASACGVSTVKPTQGRVPAYNPSAAVERGMLAQLMSVQGAICREVRDVRLATSVMAQQDVRDPWWVPAPFDDWPAEEIPVIGMTRDACGYDMPDEVDQAILRAADCLRDAGYRVEEVQSPSMAEPAGAWFDVAAYEIKKTLGPLAQEHGSQTIQNIFDWYCTVGDMVDAEGYREGIADRTRLTRQWNLFLQRYPLLLTPFLLRSTFPWNYDAESEANTHDLFKAAVYSTGVNYLGLPSGVFPSGTVDGMPYSVQLIGRRFREDQILDAMQCVEDRLGVPAHDLWLREAAGT